MLGSLRFEGHDRLAIQPCRCPRGAEPLSLTPHLDAVCTEGTDCSHCVYSTQRIEAILQRQFLLSVMNCPHSSWHPSLCFTEPGSLVFKARHSFEQCLAMLFCTIVIASLIAVRRVFACRRFCHLESLSSVQMAARIIQGESILSLHCRLCQYEPCFLRQ